MAAKKDKEKEIFPAMMQKIAPAIRLSESLNKELLPIIDLKNTQRELDEKRFQELKNLMQESKNSVEQDVALIENPFENIFLNSKAFQLFTKLHEDYKNRPYNLAHYSFVFYAMQKDGFILCGGIEFIDFLNDNFEITIPKIDNRQIGKNRKTSTYNAYKESIFKL